MNITEEHKQKAREIEIMLSRLEPEVLLHLADFMDFEGQSDEGIRSQSPYEAAEMIDVYSTDGEPQEFILDMGMSLKSVKVKFTFQEVDEKSYEIETYDVLPVDSGEQK
jgi:hypothetical protein